MKSKFILTVLAVSTLVVISCGPTSIDDMPTQKSNLPSTNTPSTPSSTPTNKASPTSTEEVCKVGHGEILLSTPGGTESVAVDKYGNLYTSDYCSGEVFRIQPDGNSSVLATLPYADNCVSGSIGVAVSDDGNIWVVVWSKKPEYNGVWKVKQDGSVNLEYPMSPEQAPMPNDLTFDNIGNLYVTETVIGTIWKAHSGEMMEPWIHLGYSGANGIAIFENNLYVSISSQYTIVKIPMESDGNAGEPTVFATDVIAPDGMIFDDQGQLYVVSFDAKTLMQISPDGRQVSELRLKSLGVSYPTDIAFAPGEKNSIAYIANLHVKKSSIVKLTLCPRDE